MRDLVLAIAFALPFTLGLISAILVHNAHRVPEVVEDATPVGCISTAFKSVSVCPYCQHPDLHWMRPPDPDAETHDLTWLQRSNDYRRWELHCVWSETDADVIRTCRKCHRDWPEGDDSTWEIDREKWSTNLII